MRNYLTPISTVDKQTFFFIAQESNLVNLVFSSCLQGGLRGDDPEITLTAFVMIALAEAKQAGVRCSDPDVNMEVISNIYMYIYF